MITNRYAYTINHLKIALARKALYFIVQNNRQTLKLLTVLRDLNFIRRFYTVPGNRLKVYLRYNKKSRYTLNIKNYYRNNTHLFVKYQSLRILHMSTMTSTFILDTSKGLMPHQRALELGIGGVLVCFIA